MALILVALAGCSGPAAPAGLDVDAAIVVFEDYTWPPIMVTDGNGNAQRDHPLLAQPERLPFYVQQLVDAPGGEPTLGITRSGRIFITAQDDVLRSEDQGRSWRPVHTFRTPLPPSSVDYWRTGDPVLWVDPVTDRIFISHLTQCTYLAWSDDEGSTWGENPHACLTSDIDHQKVATAAYGPRSLRTPVPPYPNVVYICYQKTAQDLLIAEQTQGTWCMVSLDGGRTIDYERQILPVFEHCSHLNGHPASYPDGTVIVPIGGGWGSRCERPITVSLSEDNGLTWTPRYLDADHKMTEIDPDITVTPNGVAYLVYRDEDQVVKLLRSRDKFATWEGPWRVSPADHTLDVFTVTTSAEDGRIAMAYLGTRTPQLPPTDPSEASQASVWHLFVTTVFDSEAGTPSFATQQVTPQEDPVQTGCVWLQGGTGGAMQCRNLLDFIDMGHDADGRGLIAFTDGCTPRNGCTANPEGLGQSRDRQSAFAIQVRGPSLSASLGQLESLEGYTHPRPFPVPS